MSAMTPDWVMVTLRRIAEAPKDRGLAFIDIPDAAYQLLVSWGLIDRLLHPDDWNVPGPSNYRETYLKSHPDTRRWGFRLLPVGADVLAGKALKSDPVKVERETEPSTCVVCGKEHARVAKTCSTECASINKRRIADEYRKRTSASKVRLCACGKPLEGRKNLCTACRSARQAKPPKPRKSFEEIRERSRQLQRERRERARQQNPRLCACGKPLEGKSNVCLACRPERNIKLAASLKNRRDNMRQYGFRPCACGKPLAKWERMCADCKAAALAAKPSSKRPCACGVGTIEGRQKKCETCKAEGARNDRRLCACGKALDSQSGYCLDCRRKQLTARLASIEASIADVHYPHQKPLKHERNRILAFLKRHFEQGTTQ